MAEDLGKKTKMSLVWSTIDRFSAMALTFITGIVTARLLSPHDFGLIGALTIFSAIGNILVESGFSITLLRRKEISSSEYSAVFFFNIFIGVCLYIPFYIGAPLIADFFHEEALTSLARLVFITLLINPLGIIQNVQLRRELRYKEQALSNIIGLTASGVGVYILIKLDYSYWSLAWQQIIYIGIKTICIWLLHPYKITRKTNSRIIKELLSSSIWIMLNTLFTTCVVNFYNFIVGRKYAMTDLGYFSQAKKYEEILPIVIANIVGGVAGASLVKLNEQPERQLNYLRKYVRIIAYFTFPIMIYLFLCMTDIVTLVLTDKWQPIVPYFQIFCISGILHPFHYLFYNYYMLFRERQKGGLLIECLKNTLIVLSAILVIIVFPNNIKMLIWGYVIVFFVVFIIDMLYIKRIIAYKSSDQMKDIFPNILIAIVVGLCIYTFQINTNFQCGTKLFIETLLTLIIYIGISFITSKQFLKDLLSTFNIMKNK